MGRPAGLVWFATGVLVLAACGSSSPAEPAASEGAGTTGPTTAAPEPQPDASSDQQPTTTLAAGTGEPATSGAPDSTSAPEPGSATETTQAAPEPPGMVWPDDGCSADNSPTPAAAADGPAPTLEIRAESADGPLPDLAVRRINCAGGWVNLRNELPADRPLLAWFWAPH